MHLGKGEDDVAVITSCVKGMEARTGRNAFTDSLAAGSHFPPRSKAWFFGKDGYEGRKKGVHRMPRDTGLCKCRASDFRESFCITDALLRAAILGDTLRGLFYTGQSSRGSPSRRCRS